MQITAAQFNAVVTGHNIHRQLLMEQNQTILADNRRYEGQAKMDHELIQAQNTQIENLREQVARGDRDLTEAHNANKMLLEMIAKQEKELARLKAAKKPARQQ